MARKKESASPKRTQVNTLEEIRRLRVRGSDKKSLVIKDISKVLTDIEESKRSKKIIYLSQFIGKGVYDSTKKRIGSVMDLSISGGNVFPEVSHILVKSSHHNMMIPWTDVARFNSWIELAKPLDKIDYRIVNDDDVFLVKNILDKQVVDVNGLKVIRVNDIALTYFKSKLAVVSIDVGSRSILRRLGLFGLSEFIPGFKDHPVPWGSVEPLTRSLEKIHLKVPCARVSDLHPADVADVFEELSMRERNILLKSMKSDKAAKVILECEADVRASILKSLRAKRLASILEKMPANDAANLISDFSKQMQQFLLKTIAKDYALRIQEMLSFKEGSVARYMSSNVVTVRKDLTCSETLDFIRQLSSKPAAFHYVYVVNESDTLCGVVSLKNLIMADPSSILKDMMVSKVVTIEISDPIEYVEDIISKYDLLALPVVDVNGKVRGVVNIDDVLDLIVERTKAHQPFELSDKKMAEITKEKTRKKYYSTIIRDIGQLLRDLEPIRVSREKKEKK
jgi:magnesium transporter